MPTPPSGPSVSKEQMARWDNAASQVEKHQSLIDQQESKTRELQARLHEFVTLDIFSKLQHDFKNTMEDVDKNKEDIAYNKDAIEKLKKLMDSFVK